MVSTNRFSSAEVPEVVKLWWRQLRQKTHEGSLQVIFLHMVCMEIWPPNDCHCQSYIVGGNSDVRWIHENHTWNNQVVHRLLLREPLLIEMLRGVLERDISNPDDPTMPGYGQDSHVSKRYARLLLDNFLIPSPDPTWVGKGYRPKPS